MKFRILTKSFEQLNLPDLHHLRNLEMFEQLKIYYIEKKIVAKILMKSVKYTNVSLKQRKTFYTHFSIKY